MSSDRPIGWKASLIVVAIGGAMALPISAHAQVPTKFDDMAVTGLGRFEGGALETEKVNLQTFMPTMPSGSVQQDGWTKFDHGDKTLEFAAPFPAVPLLPEEQRQWGWDLATFRFTRLKDRKVLYAYDLSDPNTVEAVLSELEKRTTTTGKDGTFWTAIGVKYGIGDINTPGDPRLYSFAAVPMKFDNASYEFIKAEHDPDIFSEAVGATVNALQQGAYDNFQALTDWSALAKELKDLKEQKTESSESEMITTYVNSAERGPLVWQSLTPLEAFIAVDRDLDIKDKPLRILTSETAWAVTQHRPDLHDN